MMLAENRKAAYLSYCNLYNTLCTCFYIDLVLPSVY